MTTPTDAVDDFMANEAPAKPQSRLAAHRASIEKLRLRGYTLKQICKFLETQGVRADPSWLSKFLRSGKASTTANSTREITTHDAPAPDSAKDDQGATRPESPPGPAPTKSIQQIMAEKPNLTKKQAEEVYVDQFKAAVTNPLLEKYAPGWKSTG